MFFYKFYYFVFCSAWKRGVFLPTFVRFQILYPGHFVRYSAWHAEIDYVSDKELQLCLFPLGFVSSVCSLIIESLPVGIQYIPG
ncbi:MAG: hypothetical protein IKP02_03795 [Paludibacteraceae bacterium]|nr:hypothetical protein [Paludibacteraceae bacterium]